MYKVLKTTGLRAAQQIQTPSHISPYSSTSDPSWKFTCPCSEAVLLLLKRGWPCFIPSFLHILHAIHLHRWIPSTAVNTKVYFQVSHSLFLFSQESIKSFSPFLRIEISPRPLFLLSQTSSLELRNLTFGVALSNQDEQPQFRIITHEGGMFCGSVLGQRSSRSVLNGVRASSERMVGSADSSQSPNLLSFPLSFVSYQIQNTASPWSLILFSTRLDQWGMS